MMPAQASIAPLLAIYVCSVDGDTITRPHTAHYLDITIFSYDDTLAVWDTRMFRGPSDQLNLGGGVWRIRQHLTDPNTLALAAMYNGFHIYDASLNSSVVHFKEHESLAYGIDFRHGESQTGLSKTLVSCSFYDHLVKVWEVTPTSLA